MNKKGNQAKNRVIKSHGQTDEKENIELGQLLRTLYPNVKIVREWFILFDSEGHFIRVQEHEPTREFVKLNNISYRHPDIMVFEKINHNIRGKLLCCMENDGDIHRIKWADTDERNKQYKDANVPLLIITKERAEISVFDEANRLLGEFLK